MSQGPTKVDNAAAGQQRLDKWLWFARIARSRALAADMAARGRVRVNGQRATQASRAVRVGDVLTINANGRILVLRIAGLGAKREAYPLARTLYEDIAAPPAGAEDIGLRD